MCCGDKEIVKEVVKPNSEESKNKVLTAIRSFINSQTSFYNKNSLFNPNLIIEVISDYKGKTTSKKYYSIISYVSDTTRYIGILYITKKNNVISVNSQILQCSNSTGLPMMDNVIQTSIISFSSDYKKL